jgi:hypothetical protein
MTEGRPAKGPDYGLLGVIALGPLLPLAGMALRKHPKYRFPVIFSLSGGILVAAHVLGMDTSINSK